MNEIFDVRINRSVWKRALEVYTDAKKQLEVVKINQENATEAVLQGWQGQAACSLLSNIKYALEEGVYQDAYDDVAKMQYMLAQNDIEIDKLLMRCEEFENQLKVNDYVEPMSIYSGGKDGTNGNVLSGNYVKLEQMISVCDDISEEANALKKYLNGIMDECSGLIPDAQLCMEQTTNAYLKLNRVINLKLSITKYVTGLRSLEEDINVMLNSMIEPVKKVPKTKEKDKIQVVESVSELGKKQDEYEKIKEYAKNWDIDYDPVKWSNMDVVYWKTLGGNSFIDEKKLKFISQYKDVIEDAAEKYNLPVILLAGVVYCEYGGDPMVIDDLAYSVRAFDWCGPEWVDENLTITANPQLTSFGNVSMQLRRAEECLGYGQDEVSAKLRKEIIDSLKDPVENIYISAKHISDLRDSQYPDMTFENHTEEQIIIVATRYNRGPDLSLEKIMEDLNYGSRIIKNQENIRKIFENE